MATNFFDWYQHRQPKEYMTVVSKPTAPISMIEVSRGAGLVSLPATEEFTIFQNAGAIESGGCVDYGAGKINSNRIGPDEYLIRPANAPTVSVSSGLNVFRAFSMNWRILHRFLDNAAGPAGEADFGRLHRSLQRSRFVADILDRLWSEAASGDVAGRLFTEGAITVLLVTLLRDAQQIKLRNTQSGLSPRQLDRAVEVMEACLSDDIGLESLAGAVGLSPAHFSRAFKQATGMPPSKWLLKRRVERAQDLMRNGDVTLADVALAVGFSAQPQFTTAFRRVTGVTPGAWRNAHHGTGRYVQTATDHARDRRCLEKRGWNSRDRE